MGPKFQQALLLKLILLRVRDVLPSAGFCALIEDADMSTKQARVLAVVKFVV